jgi:hypothetical protein
MAARQRIRSTDTKLAMGHENAAEPGGGFSPNGLIADGGGCLEDTCARLDRDARA